MAAATAAGGGTLETDTSWETWKVLIENFYILYLTTTICFSNLSLSKMITGREGDRETDRGYEVVAVISLR